MSPHIADVCPYFVAEEDLFFKVKRWTFEANIFVIFLKGLRSRDVSILKITLLS